MDGCPKFDWRELRDQLRKDQDRIDQERELLRARNKPRKTGGIWHFMDFDGNSICGHQTIREPKLTKFKNCVNCDHCRAVFTQGLFKA